MGNMNMEGGKAEKVGIEEKGRVKEDGEYFLGKIFHNLKTKCMIFRIFFLVFVWCRSI
jgi:hypothetical protein